MIIRSSHIIFLVAVSLPSHLLAQFTSENGNFRVDLVKGCAGMTVHLTDLTGNSTARYNFDYEVGDVDVGVQTSYTYDVPGEYVIAHNMQVDNSPVWDFLTIRVFPDEPPEYYIQPCPGYRATVKITDERFDFYRIITNSDVFDVPAGSSVLPFDIDPVSPESIRVIGLMETQDGTLTEASCPESSRLVFAIDALVPAALSEVEIETEDPSDGQIRLGFTLTNPDILYQIEISENGTDNFEPYDFAQGFQDEATITGLDTENNFYCFRIAAEDCDGNPDAISDTVCSVNLDVEAQNGQNELRWQTEYIDQELIDVVVNGQPLNTFYDNEKQIVDEDVTCGIEYCYEVYVFKDGSSSTSAPVCVTGESVYAPPALSPINSTYNGSIEVDWALPEVPVQDYKIVRNYVSDTIIYQNNLFTDPEFLTDRRNCYTIAFEDNCGNVSDWAEACPVYLWRETQEGPAVLNWTDYVGWGDGIEAYVLEKRDDNGEIIEEVEIAFGNQYIEQQTNTDQIINYTIRVEPEDGTLDPVYSNTIRIVFEAAAFFPNAFTPDGDGRNDTFGLLSTFINEYELKVFNRWGELVFQTDNIDHRWDGYYLNKPAPEGSYVYSAILVDQEGNRFNRTGSVYLLRK